jgi:UDP-arabinose 4-epimerase
VNVLVTGGAGYIGSHTCKSLAAADYSPVVLDDLSTGHRWAVRWGPLAVGDIANRELVAKTIERFDIRSAVHFAAHAYVNESMELPRKYFYNNVSKTLALLEALLDTGVNTIVFSSSCATYGVPRNLPIAEDHPQSPINPYGASRLFVENVLHWYEQAYSLRYTNLRYFNAAGADPDGEIGEDHTPETHLIPRVEAISGRTVPAIAGPRRAGDPPALVANPWLGQRLLGWKPRISDLPGIVRTAWEWHEHRHSRRCVRIELP